MVMHKVMGKVTGRVRVQRHYLTFPSQFYGEDSDE